jgi:integrase/recombinase XerD
MIDKAINNYLLWMIEKGYALSTWERRQRVLTRLSAFVKEHKIKWDDIFTQATLRAFNDECTDNFYAARSLRGLWRYLFEQGVIKRPPVVKPTLPQVYEQYLAYYAQYVQQYQICRARQVLCGLHDYLKKHTIELSSIKIYDLDTFLAQYNAPYTPASRQTNRACLRGFLRYLHQQGILSKDFAPLLVAAPIYGRQKPPKFLRPRQVQKLFQCLKPSCKSDFRTLAFLHLAYTLGLRPKEISLISLDDIFFQQAQLRVVYRKKENPIILPLPDDAVKAIAAYIIGARPKSTQRALFLRLKAPYGPIAPAHVARDMNAYMRKINLPSTAYWLRHTYAQNLLEGGASIFEIKEMLGHDTINCARQYLHIHTKLMREVLFNETL